MAFLSVNEPLTFQRVTDLLSAASWSDYSLDVTFLLAPSVCDETKAVPELLHGIAEAIRDAGFKEEFVAMKPGVSRNSKFEQNELSTLLWGLMIRNHWAK